jgi:hypothetical protein
MWLWSIVAEPPPSTRTPTRIESHGPPPGPRIVKCRIHTSCAPRTVTIAFASTMTSGAWMIACRCVRETIVRPSLPAGTTTCST